MILQALCGYYRRACQTPGIGAVEPGYTTAGVSAEIVLCANGDICAVNSLLVQQGKKQVPRQLKVPLPPKRSGSKPDSAFLYETVAFLFGIYDKQDGAEYRFDASERIHSEVLNGCEDEGAKALLRFFEKRRLGSVEQEGVDTSLLEDARLFVVFRLQGDERFLHERPDICKAWEKYNQSKSEDLEIGQCLVTGEIAPMARLHGNVAGFGADKPTLVGFNQASFCSYGKVGQQGANAPVSEKAAFEYVTALNMLCKDKKHSVSLAGDRLLFWAERDAPIEEAVVSVGLGAMILDEPEENAQLAQDELDATQRDRIRAALQGVSAGGKPKDYALDSEMRFYVLGVCANKTRLVVRLFYENSFGVMMENLMKHYRDIKVQGMKYEFPAPRRLLLETAIQRKWDNVPPNVESALIRSILENQPYPQSLYQAVLRRIRAEKEISALRVGILKGTLNRQAQKEVMKVALDKKETDVAYLLGRLFAMLEHAQWEALGEVNASVTDKYLNSALATPQMVFPTLLPLTEKHMAKSNSYFMRAQIGELICALQLQQDSAGKYAFPASLDANEQGKFIVGYYHQRQSYFVKKETEQPKTEENN